MTLQQQERELEALQRDADAVAVFVGSLDTARLQMIGMVIHDELVYRHEGKPSAKEELH